MIFDSYGIIDFYKQKIKKYPIFNLFDALKVEVDSNIPTACVGENYLKVNLTWFNTLSKNQAFSVLYHEALHIFYGHIYRLKNRIPSLHNIACDLYINTYLKSKKFILPPKSINIKSILRDKRFPTFRKYFNDVKKACGKKNFDLYEDWFKFCTTEEIYSLLLESTDNEKKLLLSDNSDLQSSVQINNSNIVFEVNELLSSAYNRNNFNDSELINEELKTYSLGNGCGKTSKWAYHVCPSIYETTVDWKDKLKVFLKNSLSKALTFSRPSRRNRLIQKLSKTRCVLPSFFATQDSYERVIHVWRDTSGSVPKEVVHRDFSEIARLAKDLPNNKLQLIMFTDYVDFRPELCQTRTKKLPDLSNLTYKSGGTSFKCIYDFYFVEKNKQPDICVILTDGFATLNFESASNKIGKQMIWVIDSAYLEFGKEFKVPNKEVEVIYRSK